ncbi:MAG: YigZ family protein [Treponema sp.]|nr:YigZ family protein [Treponema sp.]
MKILVETAKIEIEVKKSKFLAETFIVNSQTEARNILKEQKAKYKNSSHVVHAFVSGVNAEFSGCSDDGEPSGTAGRPILEIIKGRNCTNIMITVARWFGGTLLGTGGLVKAYSDAVKSVLEISNFEEYTPKVQFEFETPYSLYEQIKTILNKYSVENISEDFLENICIKGSIPKVDKSDFQKQIFEFSNGKISVI